MPSCGRPALGYGPLVTDEPTPSTGWSWPSWARLATGGGVGFALARWAVPVDGPPWRAGAAAVTMALVTPTTLLADRWSPRGLWPGLAVLSVGGLYLGVPETDQLVTVSGGLVVLLVADVAGRVRMDGLVVLALAAAVVWVGVWGAVSRSGALTAAMALLGLLLVAPVAERLPGPGRAWLPARGQVVALLVLQGVFVVGGARFGALRSEAIDGAVVGILGLVVLAWLARVVMGPRPW